MEEDIIALLRLFEGRVPDTQSHAWVLALALDQSKWPGAHSLHSTVRKRNLAAIRANDIARQCQYCFEEVCLASLYNETGSPMPFDSDTPSWIAKNAFDLARAVGVSTDEVVKVISPPK